MRRHWFFSYRSARSSQRGEIATVAMLLGLGIIMLGIVVGSRLQSNDTRSKAQAPGTFSVTVSLTIIHPQPEYQVQVYPVGATAWTPGFYVPGTQSSATGTISGFQYNTTYQIMTRILPAAGGMSIGTDQATTVYFPSGAAVPTVQVSSTLPTLNTCTDSDGENAFTNSFTSGVVTEKKWNGTSFDTTNTYDTCSVSIANGVWETYCNGTIEAAAERACPVGRVCSNGACVVAPSLTPYPALTCGAVTVSGGATSISPNTSYTFNVTSSGGVSPVHYEWNIKDSAGGGYAGAPTDVSSFQWNTPSLSGATSPFIVSVTAVDSFALPHRVVCTPLSIPLAVQPTSPPAPTPTSANGVSWCSDPDDEGPTGISLHPGQVVAADATGKLTYQNDTCLDGANVTEYYCQGLTIVSTNKSCQGGTCYTGACHNVPTAAPTVPPPTCNDSDGNDAGMVVGTTSGIDSAGNAFSFTDTCYNASSALENSCVGTQARQNGVVCPSGVCANGVCTSAVPTTPPNVNTPTPIPTTPPATGSGHWSYTLSCTTTSFSEEWKNTLYTGYPYEVRLTDITANKTKTFPGTQWQGTLLGAGSLGSSAFYKTGHAYSLRGRIYTQTDVNRTGSPIVNETITGQSCGTVPGTTNTPVPTATTNPQLTSVPTPTLGGPTPTPVNTGYRVAVTAPNTGGQFTVGQSVPVTWNVTRSTTAPATVPTPPVVTQVWVLYTKTTGGTSHWVACDGTTSPACPESVAGTGNTYSWTVTAPPTNAVQGSFKIRVMLMPPTGYTGPVKTDSSGSYLDSDSSNTGFSILSGTTQLTSTPVPGSVTDTPVPGQLTSTPVPAQPTSTPVPAICSGVQHCFSASAQSVFVNICQSTADCNGRGGFVCKAFPTPVFANSAAYQIPCANLTPTP